VKRAALVPILLSFLAVLFVQAPGALAHTELILSDPAEGAVLEADPSTVVLSFSEELIPDTVRVSVADGTGFVVTVAAPEVDGADVSFPWPPALTGPDYTVNYRVVSQDGHPVSGSLSFTGATPAATPPTSSAVPSPPVESPAAVASEISAADAGTSDSNSGPGPLALIGVWVGIATVAIALVLMARRARRGGAGPA